MGVPAWFLREATHDDAAALANLHHAAATVGYAGIFPPESPAPTVEQLAAEWRAALEDSRLTVLIAEGGDGIWGSVAFRPDPADPHRADLCRLHVLPARWGAGIGGHLHDAAVSGMQTRGWSRASLWALEANGRARGLYERRGWRLTGDRKFPWPGLAVAEVRYERGL